jgi:hypothetical protein
LALIAMSGSTARSCSQVYTLESFALFATFPIGFIVRYPALSLRTMGRLAYKTLYCRKSKSVPISLKLFQGDLDLIFVRFSSNAHIFGYRSPGAKLRFLHYTLHQSCPLSLPILTQSTFGQSCFLSERTRTKDPRSSGRSFRGAVQDVLMNRLSLCIVVSGYKP